MNNRGDCDWRRHLAFHLAGQLPKNQIDAEMVILYLTELLAWRQPAVKPPSAFPPAGRKPTRKQPLRCV
jgi:hypothetical protein